jgi:hypothetical protein
MEAGVVSGKHLLASEYRGANAQAAAKCPGQPFRSSGEIQPTPAQRTIARQTNKVYAGTCALPKATR